MMTCEEALSRLHSMANTENVAGMARFGINAEGTLGVGMPRIRALGREIGKDHDLAERLWQSGIHEARILASIVDRPKWVDEAQMERWVLGFDSWDVCDQVCMNLFDRTPFAHTKACEWAEREEEFVRRAGFALMAALACKGRRTPSEQLESFFPIIARHASDGRN
ncbi:MAG TPA: DNA alkylation repair protein, partial [Fimbriimonadaceae bacterium]|nr:DNA alkylation repair protein [Fimbriimonadaceae bacterium]